MNFFTYMRRMPINQKMTFAILFTAVFALIVSGIAIVTYELSNARRAALNDLSSLAKIVGASSTGALAFQDNQAADRILSELKDQKPIIAARIYTKEGLPFSTYVKTGLNAIIPNQPKADGRETSFHRVRIFHQIQFKGDRIGTIYLESGLDRVYQRIRRYALIKALVILFIIPIVLAISKIFQTVITTPIKELANVAKDVAERKDYSMRVASVADQVGQDEIGLLRATFNHMLETIESRDENLVRQAEELGRSNQDLEQFAYISSHDLQEPLRKVSTYAQMLKEQYKDTKDPNTSKYVANITGSAARMRTLIQDVLAYSQLNKPDPAMEQMDLTDTLKQVLNEMDDFLKEKKATVEFDSLPTIRANPSQMYQLFQNLITNAVKFHRPGARPAVQISSKKTGDGWIISVQDNGIGISEKYHNVIFKVFQRLNRREEFSGTGIGLAICKKIVERLGGRIWVESQPDKGSTFFFSVPGM